MKKFFSYLVLFSLCLASSIAIFPNAKTALAEEPQTENRTVFVVQSKFVANTTNGIYLFDSSDQCLKLLNSTASLSTSYYVGNCIDLCSLNDKIYMLTNAGICVFDTQNNSTSIIEVTNLQSYHKKLSVSLVNDKVVFCVYPLDTADNQTILYGIDNGSGYEFFTIEFAQNQFNQTTTISLLDIITVNDQIYLLKAYGQSITGFPISKLENDLVLSTATTLVLSANEDNPIVAMKNLYEQDAAYVVISYANKTDIYAFDGSAMTFKCSATHRHLDQVFECFDMSVNNNTVALLGDNCYYLAKFDEELTINHKMENPVCDVSTRDLQNFNYYYVSKPTKLITALGTNQTTSLQTGCYVVEIADVFLADNSQLQGYKYVMYTSYELDGSDWVGTNIFGYVITDNDCLTNLAQPSETEFVKVFENTKLYSLPSVVINAENEQNSVVKNISAKMPVKVLSYVNQYSHSFAETTTNYALVEVNGDIGFIDIKAIVSSDKRVILAIPNAELISEANVYELANTSSNILHKLSKATRVKIIEGRNSNGFLKIAYNDQDGNYFEGYIKAYNVNADSFTTTQIIGTVLVILNIVFLIVLFITKRKIVR